MARIYQRTGKKGSIWYLDYIQDGRRMRKKCGHNKRLAVDSRVSQRGSQESTLSRAGNGPSGPSPACRAR